MLAVERQKKIFNLIKSTGSVSISQLKKELGASLPTIWRDINKLDADGKIAKTHGGAVTKNNQDSEFRFIHRLEKNVALKKAIAKKASELVCNNDVIAIDSGTTATIFASYLKNFQNLTVVTTSLSVAHELLSAKNISYRKILVVIHRSK